jgi:hypothetical protein
MSKIILTNNTSSPSNPDSGKTTYFADSSGDLKYRKSDGTEAFVGQTSGNAELVRNIYVAKNGNDSTADGSLTLPFLTVGSAITFANTEYTLSSTENAIIHVAAGEYTENALTLPAFCSLWGAHYRTRIIASSGSIDLITSLGSHTIRDLLLTGVTNSSNYLLKVLTTTGGLRVLLQNIAFVQYFGVNTISNAVYGSCSSTPSLSLELRNCDFDAIQNTCITADSNTDITLKEGQVFDCSNATFLKANSACTYNISSIDVKTALDTGVEHNSTGSGFVNACDFLNVDIPIKKSNTADLTVQSSRIVTSNAQVTSYKGLKGSLLDQIESDESFVIFDQINIGLPGQGRKLNAGEGDAYALGTYCYQYDGSNFTDVSESSRSFTSSTFTFPLSGTNRSLYFTTAARDGSTSNPVLWYGLETITNTASSTDGEIVVEFWNGSSWVEINHMSTEAGGDYLPYGKKIFERTGVENVRFSCETNTSWVAHDPVSLGFNCYWIRFRLATVPTTLPVFEQWKAHSNSTSIDADGFVEHFGNARSTRSFTLPNFEAANNSPANADIYFQVNFGVGKVENKFEGTSLDQSSQIIYLPASIDTSCPLMLKVVMFSSGSTDQTDWTIRWIVNKEGDNIHNTLGDAPTTNQQVQSKNVSISPPSDDVQFTLQTTLDISDYIAENSDGEPDVLGIQIQRNGNTDANNSDMTVAVAQVFYTTWSQGDHK